MGIDIDVYYLNKKYFDIEYETSTFVKNGKNYTVPSKIHIILKHPIPFAEFKETYEDFYYNFIDKKYYDGEDYKRYYKCKDDDELVHDFWIFSNCIEAYRSNTDKTTLLLASIKTKKGWLIKYDIMSNEWRNKQFHYIEKKSFYDEYYFEADAEYYFITTYN